MFSVYDLNSNLTISNVAISNTSITSSVNYTGLFGEIHEGGSVLSLTNITETSSVTIKSAGSFAGGVSGSIDSSQITLSKVTLFGSVNATTMTGALFGSAATLTSSSATTVVTSNLLVNGAAAGGSKCMAGNATSLTMSGCGCT